MQLGPHDSVFLKFLVWHLGFGSGPSLVLAYQGSRLTCTACSQQASVPQRQWLWTGFLSSNPSGSEPFTEEIPGNALGGGEIRASLVEDLVQLEASTDYSTDIQEMEEKPTV